MSIQCANNVIAPDIIQTPVFESN